MIFLDDLSFYMGKIPAITFADESPNLNLDKESTENQIENLNMDKLSEISQSVSELLVNLDLSTYFKQLESTLNIDLQNCENTIKDINNFTLSNTKEILIENGFDIKVEYEYKNADDTKVVISKQSQTFIPKKMYKNFITSRNDTNWHYKLEGTLNSKNVELSFKNNTNFVKISCEISSDQALEFLEEYYKNYYEYIFGEKSQFTLVNSK